MNNSPKRSERNRLTRLLSGTEGAQSSEDPSDQIVVGRWSDNVHGLNFCFSKHYRINKQNLFYIFVQCTTG